MFKVKIDGVVKELVLRTADRGGWYAYNIIQNGQPVSEISVPVKLDQPFMAFKTGGHKFERIR